MSLSFAVSFTLASAPLEDQEENDLKMYMHTHMHTHAHTHTHYYMCIQRHTRLSGTVYQWMLAVTLAAKGSAIGLEVVGSGLIAFNCMAAHCGGSMPMTSKFSMFHSTM